MTARTDKANIGGKRRGCFHYLFVTVGIVFLILLAAELYVRPKYEDFRPPINPEPVGEFSVFSLASGHHPKPGYHEPSEGASSGERVWPNCQRSSRPLPLVKEPLYKVALYGCSWTYGTGAPDGSTFAWRLNSLYPNILFVNYGIPDYGAHQSYLYMKDNISKGDTANLYIYSFIYDHLFRDLCDKIYLLDNYGLYYFPGYELGHPEKPYQLQISVWPGEHQLCLIRFLHSIYGRAVIKQTCDERELPWGALDANRQAFRENVLSMRDLAQMSGGQFAVIALGANSDILLQSTLADSGINSATALTDKETIYNSLNNYGNDHPNGLGHAKIADAVSSLLNRQNLPAKIMKTNDFTKKYNTASN